MMKAVVVRLQLCALVVALGFGLCAGSAYDEDQDQEPVAVGLRGAAAGGAGGAGGDGSWSGWLGLGGAGALPPVEGEKESTFTEATARSFAMIMVSEMGDETFIIAAILAMRHPRAVILAGSLAALYVMTVLSAAMGFVIPNLISPDTTHKIATFMYFFFGFRLAYIAYYSDGAEVTDEIEEVEKSLRAGKPKSGWRNKLGRIFTPVLIEAFVLTFLAEWGDRSQIATITLAAHSSPVGVSLGAIVGHTICTTIAVYGGKLIATKISQRTVALSGSATFFIFAFLNLKANV